MEAVLNREAGASARPFVKWAGGKNQLLNTLQEFYPEELNRGELKKYIEPFVGGGAVLFDILQNFNIEEAFIFDINSDLINSYNIIKYHVDDLIEELKYIEYKYIYSSSDKQKQLYYDIRDKYNESSSVADIFDIKRAAQFIFLNRTCYNGLYRVNRNGLFNVPMGHYKNPTICDEENLKAVQAQLQRVNIFIADYRESIKFIDRNSFVYLDPPYRPLNGTSHFTSYSKYDFKDQEQIALAQFFDSLDELGAKVMLSNSDPKNEDPDDNFFDELFCKYNIYRVKAKRMINSNSSRRGLINEILVTNYPTNQHGVLK